MFNVPTILDLILRLMPGFNCTIKHMLQRLDFGIEVHSVGGWRINEHSQITTVSLSNLLSGLPASVPELLL